MAFRISLLRDGSRTQAINTTGRSPKEMSLDASVAVISDPDPEIPWRMMKGLRNVLAHEYSGVDLDIIWETIKDDLPKLKKQLTD